MNNETNNEVEVKAETKAPKVTAPKKAKAKAKTPKLSPKPKLSKEDRKIRDLKRNMQNELRQPQKYGKKTLSSNWMLSQLEDQISDLNKEKSSASKYAKTAINNKIEVLENLKETVIKEMVLSKKTFQNLV